MKKRIYVILITLFLLLVILWIVYTNCNIETNRIAIENTKIPIEFNNFKIAEISDLHNKNWGDKLVRKIKKEKPDMIAITGDFIDSSNTNYEVAMKFIKDVKDIAPIYYVAGNHEAWTHKYKELKEKLLVEGVIVLDNENILFEKNNSKINIIGLQDPDFIEKTSIKGIQEDIIRKKLKPLIKSDLYNIVLSHRPEAFESYVEEKADLVLTGHAHGGQVRIPFVGGLIAPNQGFFPKYTEGVYHENNTDMVVSRGLGNSILPIRINNMPELVIVKLNNDLEKQNE